MYEHLLRLRGMAWDSTVAVEFFGEDGVTLGVHPITAREGWDFSIQNWSLWAIADCRTARKLGAHWAAFA